MRPFDGEPLGDGRADSPGSAGNQGGSIYQTAGRQPKPVP